MQILEFNTNLLPIFNGTYGGLFDFNEMIEREAELLEDNEDLPEYDHEKYMQAILSIYRELEPELLNAYQAEGFPIKRIVFTGYYSPKYYNFTTDQLDFDLFLEDDYIQAFTNIANGFDQNEWKQWLHDNFASRDGFMSFTPSTASGVIREIHTDRNGQREQAIAVVMQYKLKDQAMENVELQAYEQFTSNGYLLECEQ